MCSYATLFIQIIVGKNEVYIQIIIMYLSARLSTYLSIIYLFRLFWEKRKSL